MSGGGGSTSSNNSDDETNFVLALMFTPIAILAVIGFLFLVFCWAVPIEPTKPQPPRPVIQYQGKVVKSIESDFHALKINFEDGHFVRAYAFKGLSVERK